MEHVTNRTISYHHCLLNNPARTPVGYVTYITLILQYSQVFYELSSICYWSLCNSGYQRAAQPKISITTYRIFFLQRRVYCSCKPSPAMLHLPFPCRGSDVHLCQGLDTGKKNIYEDLKEAEASCNHCHRWTPRKTGCPCHPPSQAAIHISSMFKLMFNSPRVVIPNQKGQNLNCTAACQHAPAEGQFQMRRGKRLNAGTSENLLHTFHRKSEQQDEFSCSPHRSYSLHYQRTAPQPLGITKARAIHGYK